jgi:hypothetical protein
VSQRTDGSAIRIAKIAIGYVMVNNDWRCLC